MRPELPTGTVTFVFTDVEGSTSLLTELGVEQYADALAAHRKAIREASADRGGVEVDTQGDAFLLAFPTAPGALAAASEFTESLATKGLSASVVKLGRDVDEGETVGGSGWVVGGDRAVAAGELLELLDRVPPVRGRVGRHDADRRH